jgi:hypothetical protein
VKRARQARQVLVQQVKPQRRVLVQRGPVKPPQHCLTVIGVCKRAQRQSRLMHPLLPRVLLAPQVLPQPVEQ